VFLMYMKPMLNKAWRSSSRQIAFVEGFSARDKSMIGSVSNAE